MTGENPAEDHLWAEPGAYLNLPCFLPHRPHYTCRLPSHIPPIHVFYSRPLMEGETPDTPHILASWSGTPGWPKSQLRGRSNRPSEQVSGAQGNNDTPGHVPALTAQSSRSVHLRGSSTLAEKLVEGGHWTRLLTEASVDAVPPATTAMASKDQAQCECCHLPSIL